MPLNEIFALLVLYQLKHYVADFPLQGEYMLGKFKKVGWVLPLTAHCIVHAGFTLAIVSVVNPSLWWLAVFDFVVHFIMDRIKASPDLLGQWSPAESQFWYALGLDQMVHHLTHYVIIWTLIKHYS